MSALKPHLAPEQKQQRSTDLMIFVFDLLVIYSVYSLLAIEHFSTDGYALAQDYSSTLPLSVICVILRIHSSSASPIAFSSILQVQLPLSVAG